MFLSKRDKLYRIVAKDNSEHTIEAHEVHWPGNDILPTTATEAYNTDFDQWLNFVDRKGATVALYRAAEVKYVTSTQKDGK
jgi:hypothetical protein